jgi:hypothetical protein
MIPGALLTALFVVGAGIALGLSLVSTALIVGNLLGAGS